MLLCWSLTSLSSQTEWNVKFDQKAWDIFCFIADACLKPIGPIIYIFFFQDEQPKKDRAVYKCWRNKWGRSQRNYYLWGRSQHNYYLHSYKCVHIHNLNFYYLWKVLTGIWLSIDNLDHLIIGNQLAPLLSLSIFRLLFFVLPYRTLWKHGDTDALIGLDGLVLMFTFELLLKWNI